MEFVSIMWQYLANWILLNKGVLKVIKLLLLRKRPIILSECLIWMNFLTVFLCHDWLDLAINKCSLCWARRRVVKSNNKIRIIFLRWKGTRVLKSTLSIVLNLLRISNTWLIILCEFQKNAMSEQMRMIRERELTKCSVLSSFHTRTKYWWFISSKTYIMMRRI